MVSICLYDCRSYPRWYNLVTTLKPRRCTLLINSFIDRQFARAPFIASADSHFTSRWPLIIRTNNFRRYLGLFSTIKLLVRNEFYKISASDFYIMDLGSLILCLRSYKAFIPNSSMTTPLGGFYRSLKSWNYRLRNSSRPFLPERLNVSHRTLFLRLLIITRFVQRLLH